MNGPFYTQRRRPFSAALSADILMTTRAAALSRGVINLSQLAESVRRRNAVENVALEDIEYAILDHGLLLSAMLEFDRSSAGELHDQEMVLQS